MQLHNLKRNTKNKKSVQVGRGGARGKTSGRGTKGQGARAGRKIRPELRDRIKKIPKLRGRGKNSNLSIQTKPLPVTLAMIEKAFENGSEVTIATLIKTKLVSIYKGKAPKVKIVGNKKDETKEASFSKKVTVSGIPVTASVRVLIEKGKTR